MSGTGWDVCVFYSSILVDYVGRRGRSIRDGMADTSECASELRMLKEGRVGDDESRRASSGSSRRRRRGSWSWSAKEDKRETLV